MTDLLTRRRFLGTVASSGLWLVGGLPLAAARRPSGPSLPKAQIHKVYVVVPGASWPKPEFDVQAEVARLEAHLTRAEEKLGDVRFVGGELVGTSAEAAQVVAGLGDAAGMLAVHLSLGTGPALETLVAAGLPTVVFSQPFSGHEWMYVPQWQQAGRRVVLLASSDYGELARAASLLRVPAHLRHTRVLVCGGPAGTPRACSAEEVARSLGVEVLPLPLEELVEAHQSADPDAAAAEARQWIAEARKVLEPPPEEIVKSSRMHLAMRQLLEQRRAQAITMRCLGGIPIDTLGYPCLGFSRLLDEGLVGACEADMDSTLTMLLFQYAFGVPGFISDPLFDTARNAVIHAHCTAPTRMGGVGDRRAPYLIRTHRDDNRGAALEVQMHVGEVVTCAKLANLDTLLVSVGKITEVPDFDDRGCRTQIVTEVADPEAMMNHWGGGVLPGDMMTLLHRVVFYGDHRRSIRDLAALMGLRVVVEG